MASSIEHPVLPRIRLARLTGLAYLGIILTGVFAEFVVRGSLIAAGDPIATATNVAGSPTWFRVGIGADVLMIVLDVVVAVGLYLLLRDVDRRLARVAMWLRLIQGTVIVVNLVNLVRALELARQAAAVGGAIDAALAREALDAVERHGLGYDVGLIAFALSCLVVGHLLRKGRLVSRPLALGLSAAGVVYLLGSFAALFAPGLSGVIEPLYVVPLVAELGLALRLAVRGGWRSHGATVAPVASARPLALVAVVAIGASACTAAPAPDDVSCGDACATAYAERGDHAVGTVTEAHGALALRAWYPAAGQAEGSITYPVVLQLPGFPTDPMPIFGRAIEGAPIQATAEGLPLVILSHGFALNPEWYAPLAEHLASHGFFVLAPLHRETDWATDVVMATATRPEEIRGAIDLALGGSYGPYLDGEHVGLVGHSYGGYTTLAAGGARIDYAALREHCERTDDVFARDFLCPPFVEGEQALADAMGLEVIPTGLWPSMADARIDAIVPIAGDAYAFGADGLARVQVPMLAVGGTADTGTPWGWGAALAYQHAGSADRRLLGLEGGEHFLPVADCEDMPWMADMPEEFRTYICDDPRWAKEEAHARIHHFVTAFLLETLRDDARAREALRPEHYTDPASGLRYERSTR